MSYIKEVGNSIYNQLGGIRFKLMTGAYDILCGGEEKMPYLRMKLRRNKSGYNYLRIFYDAGSDYYMMEWSKYKNKFTQIVKQEKNENLSFKQMKYIFENMTGLYLTL